MLGFVAIVGYSKVARNGLVVIRQNPREPVRELSLVRWGLIQQAASYSPCAGSQ